MINKLLFLIFAGGAVIGLFPNPASGSDAFSVATNIPHTPKLKPASSFKLAAVCFAGSDDCGSQGLFNRVGEDEVITMDPEEQCLAEGYSKNICNNGQIVKDPCPYHEDYNKGCACPSDFSICSGEEDGNGQQCVLDGQTYWESCSCKASFVSCNSAQDGVGVPCGGKYESCVCKPNLISCNEVQDGVGDVCGGKYASCQCKDSLIQCGTNQEGVGEDCNGKYAKCKCPDGWTTCEEGGPAKEAEKCSIGGDDYYSQCAPVDNDPCEKTVLSKYGTVVSTEEEFLAAVDQVNLRKEGFIIVMNNIKVTKPIFFTNMVDIKTKNSFRDEIPACKTDARPSLTFDTDTAISLDYQAGKSTFNDLKLINDGGHLFRLSGESGNLTMSNITLQTPMDSDVFYLNLPNLNQSEMTIEIFGDLFIKGNINLEKFTDEAVFTIFGSLMATGSKEINLGDGQFWIKALPEGYDEYPVKPIKPFGTNYPLVNANNIKAGFVRFYCPKGGVKSITLTGNGYPSSVVLGLGNDEEGDECPLGIQSFTVVIEGRPDYVFFQGMQSATATFNTTTYPELTVKNATLNVNTPQPSFSRLFLYASTLKGSVEISTADIYDTDNFDVIIKDSKYSGISLNPASYSINEKGSRQNKVYEVLKNM